MANISSFPVATPTANDTLIGTKFIENKEATTNSFNLGEVAEFVAGYISVSPIFIGTANGLSLNGATLSLALASGSTNGALSSTGFGNLNSAYNEKINSISVTGTTTKLLTLNRQNASPLTASWVDGGGGAIAVGSPANGLSIVDDFLYIALASGSATGALSSANWTTFNNKQDALTFSSPLVKTSNTISIQPATSTQSGYLTANNWNAFNDKQGALDGSGIVKSTAGAISYLTDNSANWNTAYSNYITTAAVTGTTTKTLKLTRQDSTFIEASWTDDGGSVTIGAISGTSTANGASITSGVLNLAPADGTNGGVVTNAAQTFGGKKTFANGAIISIPFNGGPSLIVNHSGNGGADGAKFNSAGDTTSYGASTVSIDSCNYGTGIRVYTNLYANASQAMQFYSTNTITQVGGITCTVSATAYNTSSDYRLKENVEPMINSLDRVDALQPCRFNFIIEPAKVVDGFIAHEVQAIVPEAVAGTKDAVDPEGTPIYQGIDQAKLVPLLTAAIQELHAKVKALELLVNPQ